MTKPNLKLHSYQEKGVEHLHANPRAALFLDMGLGKTATTLSALTSEHLPALVIAPKRVAESVWPAETPKWRPGLSVELAAGSKKNRQSVLTRSLEGRGADITVLGKDNTKDLALHPKKTRPWRTLIIDESSIVKNRSTAIWKNIARYVKADDGPENVWLLTGTPSPNGLMDLWSQVWLLDRGERLGRTLTGYREKFFTAGRRINNVVVDYHLKYGAADKIHTLLSDICLSMSAEDYLELPPVTENVVKVRLSSAERKAFDAMRSNKIVEHKSETFSAANAAVAVNRLTQISAGFMYRQELDQLANGVELENLATGDYAEIGHTKIDAVKEILDGHGDGGVLIFYRYQAEAERMLAAIPGARHVNESGAIEEWNAGKVSVMLAHPASAGHGLNLQYGGHTIIWTTLPWSLEQWEQANARLARQGQTRPVIVHRLEAENSTDPVIYEALMGKTEVQDALLAYLSPNEAKTRYADDSEDFGLNLSDIMSDKGSDIQEAIEELI